MSTNPIDQDLSRWYQSRRVRPTAAQDRAARLAIEWSRTMGLRLPPYRLEFVRREYPDDARGHCFHFRRPVAVYVLADLTPEQVVETVLHELQHVADSGDAEMPPDEREERAEAFTLRALAALAEHQARWAAFEARAGLR